jgi:hypothetical protein
MHQICYSQAGASDANAYPDIGLVIGNLLQLVRFWLHTNAVA